MMGGCGGSGVLEYLAPLGKMYDDGGCGGMGCLMAPGGGSGARYLLLYLSRLHL